MATATNGNDKASVGSVKAGSDPSSTATTATTTSTTTAVAAATSSSSSPKPSVRFAAGTKPRRKLAVPLSETHNPRVRFTPATHKGKGGKKGGDIRLVLALVGGFFAFIGIMVYMALGMNEAFKMDPAQKAKSRSFKDLAKTLQTAGQALSNNRQPTSRKRTTDCHLFFSEQSSVPQAGVTFFAGKKYKEGDVVIEADLLHYLEEESKYISHASLLLKHHPTLANLKEGTTLTDSPDGTNKGFVASRVIKPGEELFLPFEDHPHSALGLDHPLFQHLPTEEDYDMMDKILIIQKQLQMSKYKVDQRHRSRSGYGGGSRSIESIKEIVDLFNPRIGGILPTGKASLMAIVDNEASAVHSVLRNHTVFWLDLNGKCADAFVQNDDSGTLVARRSVKKGGLVSIVPLLAKHRSDCDGNNSNQEQSSGESTCSTTTSGCFGHPDSGIQLCPLMDASQVFLNSLAATATTGGATPNAEYQWSPWNHLNKFSQKQTVDEAIKKYPLKLTFDIVATTDIAEGEAVVVKLPEKQEAYGIPVPDKFFSAKWRGEWTE